MDILLTWAWFSLMVAGCWADFDYYLFLEEEMNWLMSFCGRHGLGAGGECEW